MPVEFCYPDAACELSALGNGNFQLGFAMQGEWVGDQSGSSVSGAGDINGDGVGDVVIGAPYAFSNGYNSTGKIYVIFGSRNATVWGNGISGLINLTDGRHGFVLQGEAAYDYSGVSVSSAGDLNGDGVEDLLIGAPHADTEMQINAGKTYVIFGSRDAMAWGNGILNLSSLMDGRRGFMLQGEGAYDYSGSSVSKARDMNGDEVDDVIIGAPGALPSDSNSAGKSYVVFGMRNEAAWGNGILDLSSLMDGQRGFVLQGEAIGDKSGSSVSSAGDLNGDGVNDVVIGAYGALFYVGKSYVVFGMKNETAWGNGTLDLNNLMNGIRGFVLQGEMASDSSGFSVSGVGDVNGDEVSDVVIGALNADPNGYIDAGKSYIVFGTRNSAAWGNGILDLSSLMDGQRGFMLQGEAAGDQSGTSVSNAGDVNGDGIGDVLIGAPGASPGGRGAAGRSYIIFGGSSVSFGGTLKLSTLDGINGFKNNGEVVNGRSGFSVSFAGDMNGDSLSDVLIGAYGFNNNMGRSYVVWGVASHQVSSQLSLTQGEVTSLNLAALSLYDSWNQPMLGTYFIVNTMQGQFELILQNPPGQSIPQFTTQQVTQSEVFFVHDGGDVAPNYLLNLKASEGWSFGGLTPQVNFTAQSQLKHSSIMSLSSLKDGQRGFALQGEAVGDQSGVSVSSAGDVNGDGVSDLLIGARYADPSNRADAGKTYVVFGTTNLNAWGNGVLDFSSLMDGQRGFELQGEVAYDNSGMPVSSAGDLNGDGIGDVLIGAPFASSSGLTKAGKSYVVFGTRNSAAWGSGILNLGDLMDGQRGFVMQGELLNDFSGWSVSNAGDVNGDGVDDILVGAPGLLYGAQIGKTYVVFGTTNLNAWGNGVLDFSSLMDGQRGFVLQGEAAGDQSGASVSGAGDVNGDGIDDMLIGAYLASPVEPGRANAGKSYVVFGTRNSAVWGSGVLSLGDLMDGQRGFVMQGELAGDGSGFSISGAGDVNGDGVDDILIGAPNAYPVGRFLAGKTYVVFGMTNLNAWGSEILDLSSLMDGQRGFELQGEAYGDQSGWSVSSLSDMNGDGVDDVLIGAPHAAPNGRFQSGRSYVIFGKLSIGASGVLDLSSLDGSDGFKIDGETSNDQSGFSVASSGDINGDSFDDLLVGAYGFNNYAGRSYVVFGGNKDAFVVSKQQLPLRSGQILRLGAQHLNISYPNPVQDNSGIQYSVQFANHSRFELELQPSFPITQFTQADITQNKVQFVHDASAEVPVYQLQVTDGFYVRMLPSLVNFNAHPVFINNSFPINQGSPLAIDSNILAVSDRESPLSYLTISVSNSQGGRFESVAQPEVPLSEWNPLNITDGLVQFVPDGSITLPSFMLMVSDQVNSFSVPSQVNFDRAPVLGNNLLSVNQGLPLTLNPSMLSATDTDSPLSALQFVITELQHGAFNQFNGSTLIASNLNNFTQQAVINEQIQFWHDGADIPPQYQVAVSDGRITIPPVPAVINFNYAPVLTMNPFIIDQGQPTLITPKQVSATDRETASVNLVFQVSNVTGGYFEYTSNIDFVIEEFLQSQVTTGNVQFAQNGSDSAPTFAFRVSDGSIWTSAQMANITLNHRPIVEKNISDVTCEENRAFTFTLDPETFSDADGDPLSWSAALAGGVPLPPEITFDPIAYRFEGVLKTLAIQPIEVKASDPRGLTAKTGFNLQALPPPSGINYQALLSALSTIGGVFLTLGGYFWWRRTTAKHRQEHDLANYLRKALNLYYHDFDRQDGDAYKLKIERLINELNKHDHFYEKLDNEQRQSFAVCLGEIIQQQGYLTSAKCGNGFLAWLLCFSPGWPVQLDLKAFDHHISQVALKAVTTWHRELQRPNGNPLTRWPYHAPTSKDKLKAYCCCCTNKTSVRSQGDAEIHLDLLMDQKSDAVKSQKLIESLSSSRAIPFIQKPGGEGRSLVGSENLDVYHSMEPETTVPDSTSYVV